MALSLIFWIFFVLGRLCAAQNAALSTLPYDFTLAALNTSFPNSNSTGAPLVLGQNGATRGFTSYVTSTYASFPYNDYPTIRLFNGSLRAYRSDADGSPGANATNLVQSGDTLGWVSSTRTTIVAQNYSSVTVNDSLYSLLAFDGYYDSWSLCPFPGPSGQTNIVFKVPETAQNLNYDPKQCYGVRINIVNRTDKNHLSLLHYIKRSDNLRVKK